MKFRIFVSLLFIISQSACSQNFDAVKDQEVILGDEQVLMSNIKLFEGDDFDSVDIEIFSDQRLIGTMILEMMNNKESEVVVTYKDLYNKLLELKQNPVYPKLRQQRIALNKLDSMTFLNTKWDTVVILLRDIGMGEKEIESFKIYAQENSDLTTKVADLLPQFHQQLEREKSINKDDNKTEWETLFLKSIAINEDSLIERSRNQNKPVLLYFTGHNSVNCRRLEQSVLLDSEIVDLFVNKFLFVPLYVDDRTALPKPEVKKANLKHNRNITLKTIGDKNSYYQLSRFEIRGQPFFVILDSEKNVIDTADYGTNTEKKFLDFLESALQEFNLD